MTQLGPGTLIKLQEQYEQARCLLEEKIKNNPEAEPYKSKYAAKKVLNNMKSTLVSLIDDIRSSDTHYELLESMLGAVWLMLGVISVDTEEVSTGDEQFNNCLNRLQEKALIPRNIMIVLSALNQLGILWDQLGDAEKSYNFLHQSEQLYVDYTDQVGERPVDIPEIFGSTNDPLPQTKSENRLENIHTYTLFYLAQICAALGRPIQSAVYCHTTLKRQLENKCFDSVEWAVNSATLAQFFIEKNGFKQSRHHLAAASSVLDQYKEVMIDVRDWDDKEYEAKLESFRNRSADVARCWAKYGTLLLTASKERLMAAAATDDLPANKDPLPDELSDLQFSTLELSSYESQVTANYVLTFDEAREVFLHAQASLNKAKEYYTFEEYASDYVAIIQEHSQLYVGLIFFEEDEDRQCKMNKRRCDLLESVATQLSLQHYKGVLRQLWFELGDAWSDVLCVKWARLQAAPGQPCPNALDKLNRVAERAKTAFIAFLSTLLDAKTKEVPAVFACDYERPALLAYFYLGRVHTRFISPVKSIQLQNVKSALYYYKKVVDYCDTNESARTSMAAELALCRDMVQLLPLKISKMTHALQLEPSGDFTPAQN